MLSTGSFPDNMKLAAIKPVLKKKDPLKRKTIDRQVFYQLFQRFLKDSCKSKLQVTWKKFLSAYSCDYPKNFNTQQALLDLIQNWKKVAHLRPSRNFLRDSVWSIFFGGFSPFFLTISGRFFIANPFQSPQSLSNEVQYIKQELYQQKVQKFSCHPYVSCPSQLCKRKDMSNDNDMLNLCR